MIFHKAPFATSLCNRNIEMTPLCKVDVTLAGVEEPRGCAVPVVSMSKKEFDRLEVLLGVQSGRLRVADACELLSLKRRQVFPKRPHISPTNKCF
jgi:hypothetical protein